MLETLYQGLLLLFNFSTMGMIAIGVLVGIVFGCLPGLTTAMAMSIFVPITFFLDPLLGIPFLVGIYKGGIYGGSIPAILIGTPGTGASVATVADGYEMTKQGKSGKALHMALDASVLGDSISSIFTIFTISFFSQLARQIGVVEIFAVLVFTFIILTNVSDKGVIKGLISGTLGLVFSIVGLDIFTGTTRLTFGSNFLMNGISFIPLLIGAYAMSEMIAMISRQFKFGERFIFDKSIIRKGYERVSKSELFSCLPTIIRSSFIGMFIGAVPGIGQSTAAFLSLNIAKNSSKNPEKFGKGALEGIAAAESGNNAVNGTTFIPLLTLGIPGDVITAILLGAFVVHGLRPGPFLMRDYGPLVSAILLSMMVANIFLYIEGKLLLPLFSKIVLTPKEVLIPIILSLIVVGGYSINNSILDLGVILIFGVLGYFMKLYGFPLAPFIILFMLGSMIEISLGQTLIKGGGNLSIIFLRPISRFIIILTVLFIVYQIYNKYFKKKVFRQS